jgi:hypothetical protein
MRSAAIDILGTGGREELFVGHGDKVEQNKNQGKPFWACHSGGRLAGSLFHLRADG